MTPRDRHAAPLLTAVAILLALFALWHWPHATPCDPITRLSWLRCPEASPGRR